MPVFLAGAWQDEQTGGHFPAMLDQFTSSPHLYATHDQRLAHRVARPRRLRAGTPSSSTCTSGSGCPTARGEPSWRPVLASALTGVSGLTLPAGPDFTGMTYDEALAAFEARKPVRVLFEEGAAEGEPPARRCRASRASFDSWPVPERRGHRLVPRRRRLACAARPSSLRPGQTTPRSYRADPTALPATIYTGPGSRHLAGRTPTYDWQQIPAGTGLGWITAAAAAETVVPSASGSVDLWVRTPGTPTPTSR